jgi:hypothetical protein
VALAIFNSAAGVGLAAFTYLEYLLRFDLFGFPVGLTYFDKFVCLNLEYL